MKAQLFVVDIIKGKKRGAAAFFFKPILFFFSLFFKVGSGLIAFGYDIGWLRSYKSSLPVISVGNITAGGTGKTPYIIELALQKSKYHKVAVLLRGYKGLNEKKNIPLIVEKSTPAKESGDEALLIKRSVEEAIVIVCKNRLKSVNLAKSLGATLILLDDGFQHRKIKRDEDIVIVDALDPVSSGYFLPRGFLRESPKALKRATKIIINNKSQLAEEIIKKYSPLKPSHLLTEISGLYDMQGVKVNMPFEGQKVAIFSAIGNPHRFKTTVESAGFDVIDSLNWLDHENINYKQLKEFSIQAKEKGAQFLICTQKDQVKWNYTGDIPLKVYWIGIICRGD
jgi:tetraacyldisaccharide 4'-kinase